MVGPGLPRAELYMRPNSVVLGEPMRKRKIVWPLMLLVIATTGGLAIVRTQTQQSVPVDFTMVALEVFQPAKGSSVRRAERTFYSRSDGSFATVVDSYDQDGALSNRETIVGEIGRGLFRVSAAEKKLIFIAPAPADASSPFSGDLKSNPNYHGEDSVLGYRTVVLRKQRKDSYTDLYYALDLKSIIKTVSVSPAGTTTIEPTSIVTGPVDSALVKPKVGRWLGWLGADRFQAPT